MQVRDIGLEFAESYVPPFFVNWLDNCSCPLFLDGSSVV